MPRPSDLPHVARRWWAAAWLLLLTATSGLAQTITLPTVRAFGPGPEEAMLFRLVAEVRTLYSADTLPGPAPARGAPVAAPRPADSVAADGLARRLLPRLDRLLLASVTNAQLRRLESAKLPDSLTVLAGDRYMPNDPIPGQVQKALDRLVYSVLSDTALPCRALDARDRDRLEKEFRPDSGEASDRPGPAGRAVRVACLRDQLRLRERSPALLLGSPKYEEATEGHEFRAAKLDSLARVATAVVVLRKINGRWFAPVQDRAQAEAFWRQRGIAPLNVGSIAGSGRAGTAFTELASPLLKAVRVSVNAVLAAETSASGSGSAGAGQTAAGALVAPDMAARGSDAAIQRLLTGGGLFNVGFAWPVVDLDRAGGDLDVMALLVPRVGLTAPVLGAVGGDSSSLNADLGVELHSKALDLIDGVGVAAQLRLAQAWGPRRFLQSVGVADKPYARYATASFGFLFGRQYLVTASRAIAGARAIRDLPWQIGLTVVRLPARP